MHTSITRALVDSPQPSECDVYILSALAVFGMVGAIPPQDVPSEVVVKEDMACRCNYDTKKLPLTHPSDVYEIVHLPHPEVVYAASRYASDLCVYRLPPPSRFATPCLPLSARI
ncbi:hypothetical protein CRM22_004039 [Opisthorchis felineus]|uniref:Uncharacterized protein n=1 Tax=Opisthorchis felineus TaxID=147828 RepID=A0A4S2LYD7_OPIFE|nr:hypothetical protein CRM22_004039 [Opisthorchis felineus]